jgi:E3 ubiquitin-protein ligase UBR4
MDCKTSYYVCCFCYLVFLAQQALPPMVVTYRLAGVDGEATEDTVETLQDSAAQVLHHYSHFQNYAEQHI